MEIRASCGDKPVIEMFGGDNATTRWGDVMIFEIRWICIGCYLDNKCYLLSLTGRGCLCMQGILKRDISDLITANWACCRNIFGETLLFYK